MVFSRAPICGTTYNPAANAATRASLPLHISKTRIRSIQAYNSSTLLPIDVRLTNECDSNVVRCLSYFRWLCRYWVLTALKKGETFRTSLSSMVIEHPIESIMTAAKIDLVNRRSKRRFRSWMTRSGQSDSSSVWLTRFEQSMSVGMLTGGSL
jgi:hypothetical protein